MGQRLMTIGQLADLVGVDRWRLAYLIERGDIPPPSFQVPGRRLFSSEDVEKIKDVLNAAHGKLGGYSTRSDGGTNE